MKFLEILKKEFEGFSLAEKIIFPAIILTIIGISLYMKDSKIALVSAICGISYVILAGKGRVSCYYIGLIGTVCYSYISWKNTLYGQLILYACYYFPMQILGIYKWSKHFKDNSREIEKIRLTKKEAVLYLLYSAIGMTIFAIILKCMGDLKPVMDAFCVVFSVLGLFLTVKRCVEQWHVWFFVNLISLIMWIYAYLNGSNCFATIMMWTVYWGLSIYFLILWEKEIRQKK